MDAEERDLLAAEVDALVLALDEERFRHVAGLEPEPALVRLFAARGRAAHRETVERLRGDAGASLAAAVAALRAERVQAEDEERWRAAEASATGVGPEGPASLLALERAAPREADRTRRLLLANGAAEALERAAPARESAAETRARARAEVGLVPDWRIVVEGDEALAASDDAWRDLLAFSARRELGLAPPPQGDLARADLLRLVAAPRLDGLFRAGMLPVALRLTLEPLRLDAGRVRIDDADRPGKWPGAHVFGARVSYLARGGAGDWQDLLAAVARSLAAAAQPPHRRDPVLGEALAWLLGSLLLEPRWLGERADVERRHAGDVVRALALRRLLALRADGAALRVASEVERGLSGSAWRSAHHEALTAATGAAWEPVRASRDADAPRLGGRIVGAAAGEALRLELRERFDEDWWRNPRTAEHLAGLLAAGRLPETDAPPPAAEAARMLARKLEAGR
jgi:hypothetical protein